MTIFKENLFLLGWLLLFWGVVYAVFMSFVFSLSERIEEAWFGKTRKSIADKWQYLLRARSQCMFCHKNLPASFLIPIGGNFIARYNCKDCQKNLSHKYVYAESFAFVYGVLFAVLLISQSSIEFFLITIFIELLFVATLFHIARIDKNYMLVSDESLYVLLGISLAKLFLHHQSQIVEVFLFATIWYLILLLVRRIFSYRLGLADVRLIYLLTLAAGLPQGILIPLVASISGIVFWLLKHKQDLFSEKIPFAPFLFFAWITVSLLFGFMDFWKLFV